MFTLFGIGSKFKQYNPMTVPIMTWGGLKGGLALALAMSIPNDWVLYPHFNIDLKELIVSMTYGVVLFSILIQGTSIAPLIRKSIALENKTKPPE